MKNDQVPSTLEALSQAEIYPHAYLPAAAAFCRRLKLAETINALIPSAMAVPPGLVVQAMVLDTLGGRSPLYRVEEFLAGQDVALLLGEEVDPRSFNDTTLGRSLDAIFQAGTGHILTAIGLTAGQEFALDRRTVHYDTSSVSVWGDYACDGEEAPAGPRITYGHSKDRRPDLKQFMLELLCVERGVPILGGTLSGNTSDKTSNNRLLEKISTLMARHGLGPGAFVYVADSSLVTQDNLAKLTGTPFVSRLPFTYTESERVVSAAVRDDRWIPLGTVAEPSSPSRPAAVYRAAEKEVTLYGTAYRAVVVHSSAHDQRRQKKLEKRLVSSREAVEKKLKTITGSYYCLADAQEAARRASECSTALHRVETTITERAVFGRGRPPAQGPRPTVSRFVLSCRISEDRAAVERERTVAGCFVLLTTLPAAGEGGMDAQAILSIYKGQHCVEQNFAFLKDPLVVNDLFLKTPARIEVLGMILILAVLVWRLMERSLRLSVENTGETLPGWRGRRTERPTAFMMSKLLVGVQTVKIKGIRYLIRPPGSKQNEYLKALGLTENVFLDPGLKCIPIIPAKKGV